MWPSPHQKKTQVSIFVKHLTCRSKSLHGPVLYPFTRHRWRRKYFFFYKTFGDMFSVTYTLQTYWKRTFFVQLNTFHKQPETTWCPRAIMYDKRGVGVRPRRSVVGGSKNGKLYTLINFILSWPCIFKQLTNYTPTQCNIFSLFIL
jgi:hypothetical protein